MATIKSRSLYQVRVYRDGYVFGKHIGQKGRLIPRIAALRVAKRLRRSGMDIQVCPIRVVSRSSKQPTSIVGIRRAVRVRLPSGGM